MKRRVLCVAAVSLGCGLLALTAGAFTAADVMNRLGIPVNQAQDYVWNSLTNGYFAYPGLPRLKQTPASERGAMVALIGTFARTYVESRDFAQRYASFREQRKPQPPDPPLSMEEQRRAQREELERNIRENEEQANAQPEYRAMYQEVITVLKEQLKTLDDKNNPMFGSQMEQFQKQDHERQLQQYNRQLAEWEQSYPADPEKLIRLRLEEFLRDSQDIDFSAELKPGPEGKMVFVNPAYEKKPGNWKLAYRTGRETVEAARTFAQKWLVDLN